MDDYYLEQREEEKEQLINYITDEELFIYHFEEKD